MRQQGQKTRYPGVYRVTDNSYRVRAVATDPRTGKRKEVEKLFDGSLQAAAKARSALLDEIRSSTQVVARQRVGEFAQSWIKSKAVSLDAGTASTYADALEEHVLPTLGDYWYDTLTKTDVQNWVDACFSKEWTTAGGVRKTYRRASVHGWFRVFRTMTRDAIDSLGLPRDPCARIRFPQEELSDAPKALEPEELARFLSEMRTRYPQHYALVALLAFTGLRWCHASALKWSDWEEKAGLLRVSRKHVRGEVSPVSRTKRAPGVIPIEPELAEALKRHRELGSASVAGWMFPSEAGTLRTPNSLDKAWARCLEAAKIKRRFTPHGLRYTFTDLVRIGNADVVVRRALTGHVTEEMQRKYSNVGTSEKRAAIAGAMQVLATARTARNDERVDGGESVNSGVNSSQKSSDGLNVDEDRVGLRSSAGLTQR